MKLPIISKKKISRFLFYVHSVFNKYSNRTNKCTNKHTEIEYIIKKHQQYKLMHSNLHKNPLIRQYLMIIRLKLEMN